MAKILNEEELEEFCNSLNETSQKDLVKMLKKTVREVNELRKLKEKENSILEKEQSLQDREELIKKEEENVSVLKQKYVNDEANANSKMLEINIQEETLKKQKAALDKVLNEVSDEKAKIINDFTKMAEDSYALRSQSIENEINTKRQKAQEEFDSIINQAKVIAEKIRKEAQKENEDINELKSIKTKLEQENTELKTKVDTTDSLIEEKRKLAEENTILKSELETAKGTNVTLTERTKNFEEYETLDKILQAAELSVNSVIESIKNLEKEKQNLQNEKINFEKEKELFEQDKKRFENRKNVLDERENKLNGEINDRIINENQKRELETENLKRQLEDIKNSVKDQQTIASLIEDLKMKLGETDLKKALSDIKKYNENMLIDLEEAKEPPYVIKRQLENLKLQEEENEKIRTELECKLESAKQIQKDFKLLQSENDNLKTQCQNKEQDNIILKGELERLRSTYSNPQGQQEREAQINVPCEGFENAPEKLSKDEYPKSENEWLSDIKDKIKKTGFIFPDRIVDAFHTALKTAKISPLTVLAGVSGTGKSKLPEYYARFGGINFLSVPVQPNWDCQESMTGFYNSIDNCFEPTQILRLLAQSQRDPNDQNGLNDVMTMILLDEMNLANIELYFAEFLSKLETRRGHSEKDIPSVWIKLGASKGIKKWPLKLGRNVLWTGTMNQDETTKTLSDKVLDRGIVINFPRPDKFEPFPETKLMDAQPLLPREIWEGWVRNKFDFSKNEILNKKLKEKKECVENINRELGRAGRALGHRVWQSIELYMSLYPGVVLEQDDSARQVAMEKAFEDQIVQKIMPKLRGIETRGIQGDVLSNIKGLIPETLHEDYINAQEQGYGQFMWTSSGYLLRENNMSKADDKTETVPETFINEKEDKILQEDVKVEDVKVKNVSNETGNEPEQFDEKKYANLIDNLANNGNHHGVDRDLRAAIKKAGVKKESDIEQIKNIVLKKMGFKK